MNLTLTQRRVLTRMRNGASLLRHFDVYAGYWWQIDHDRVTSATVEALKRKRLIVEGASERVFSGRQRMTYRLAPASELIGEGVAAGEVRASPESTPK